MHRIFKEEFGENIYASIQSIRIQKASSLLLTNRHATMTEIAKMCGYSAQSSFIRVFKQKFSMMPKEWRNEGYLRYSHDILQHSTSASLTQANFVHLSPTIVKMPAMRAYYIRHKGYGRSIKKPWQKLSTWLLCHEITTYKQIGLHHDNPTVTPLNACRYNACIIVDQEIKEASLPTLIMPEGVCPF